MGAILGNRWRSALLWEGPSPLGPDDPRRIGAYELEVVAGRGWMGATYLGRREGGPRVVVKAVRGGAADDPEFPALFHDEMTVARRVASPHVARVLDHGREGDDAYLVTEFVDGPTLSQLLCEGPWAGAPLRWLASGTAAALAAVHQAGAVHGNLHPGNVLMAADGPRIIDFGLVRVRKAMRRPMIPVPHPLTYAAPEQLAAREATPAVDVFAWAGILVSAATGRPPFDDSTIAVLLHQIQEGRPRLDGVPEPLRGLLEECLDKDPALRPDARQIVERLGAMSLDDPNVIRWTPPPPPETGGPLPPYDTRGGDERRPSGGTPIVLPPPGSPWSQPGPSTGPVWFGDWPGDHRSPTGESGYLQFDAALWGMLAAPLLLVLTAFFVALR